MEGFIFIIGLFLITLVVPVVVGFLMGRYCAFVVRLVVVVSAVYYGYLMVAGRGHYFSQLYLLPVICYTFAVALGLGCRERRRKTSAGMWQNLD
jgi:hypothetical protein